MISTYSLIASVSIVLSNLLPFSLNAEDTEEDLPTIGIIQTATHPALDQAKTGFISCLSKLLNGKVRFVIQNAEGSLPQAHTIAASFHTHRNIDAIFAIGTPAVQAIARVEKQKPIFIAAVSDPESLGILHPETNVCGTTDRIDTDAQATLISKTLPSAKTVAIIYNPGETNSQVMVEKMKSSLKKIGLVCSCFGIQSESEIAQTIASASRKNDLLLVPADNLMVGAMPLIAREALKKNCPLIASDLPSVAKGALMAQGANYSDLGKHTARLAYKVLRTGVKPQEIGIEDPAHIQIMINKLSAKMLNITLPSDLLNTALAIDNEGEPQ